MDLLPYLISGAIAGLLSGLLGVGGGLVIVPALAWLFASQGFAADSLMHFAVATSLATIIPTSIASVLAHHRRGSVHWPALRGMLPGLLAGALAGAWLARQASSGHLALLFGLFEMLVAVQLLLDLQARDSRPLPGRAGLGFAGSVIGGVSAILGIGGGTLSVPFLRWNRVDIRSAVGTAAACGLPIALAAVAGYLVGTVDHGAAPAFSTGFIYWPAVALIALASVPLAPLGARLAHWLPPKVLQRVFALLLALVGMNMVLGA